MAEVLCEGAEVSSVTNSAICETTSIPPIICESEIEIRRLKFAERTGSNGSVTGPAPKRRKTKSSHVTRREQAKGPSVLVESNQKPVNPEEELVRLDCVVQRPRYGMTSVCGRRRDMEDSVSIRPDFVENRHFFGVFDGHGCSHVATACQELMHDLVSEEWEKIQSKDAPSSDGWTDVMKQSFNRMDEEAVNWSNQGRSPTCRCQQGRAVRSEHVGSTAVVAVVGPLRIIVANCGDSRAVLSRNGVAIPLSVDHKPDRPDELERIQSAGGRVIYWDGPRVLGVLAMSRAIGDSHLKPFVTAEPEVTITDREEGDECLILASDGLWDVVTNEMACEVVRTCLRNSEPARDGEGEVRASDKACSDAALLLTKLALARRSADNVSVLVVDLCRNF